MKNNSVILFDGVCNLCNASVQFVIKHDPAARFTFASLQSDSGQKLLEQYHLQQTNFNSFVLIENEVAYTKSTAALLVAKRLKGLYKLFYGFIIVPKFIRDAVYSLVAKNRYKWFGKKDSCMIPTAALQSKFLK